MFLSAPAQETQTGSAILGPVRFFSWPSQYFDVYYLTARYTLYERKPHPKDSTASSYRRNLKSLNGNPVPTTETVRVLAAEEFIRRDDGGRAWEVGNDPDPPRHYYSTTAPPLQMAPLSTIPAALGLELVTFRCHAQTRLGLDVMHRPAQASQQDGHLIVDSDMVSCLLLPCSIGSAKLAGSSCVFTFHHPARLAASGT